MSWLIRGSYKDDDFASVSLLLHGNGTNGSTTITDNSPSPKTVTAFGNAQVSTAIADPFGNSTGVIAFDGTGDYLIPTASNDFALGTGLFTIECWVYIDSTQAATAAIWGLGGAANNSIQLFTSQLSSNLLRFNVFAGGFITASASLLNQWVHVACVREGTGAGQTKMYVNGISAGSTTYSASPPSTALAIGRPYAELSQEHSKGFVDDFRITKGIARYTANFTPPTAPFPDI